MSLAAVLNLTNNMYLVLPVTVVAAILLLRTGKNTKIQGDAAVAMISVASLALGYLIVNVFKPSNNLSGDVCTTLFGSYSILTLTPGEVWLCVTLSLAVIAAFIVFYNKIFAVTFDEAFAQAVGNLVIAIIIAVIIVLAMNLVGSLLISALVIFPALSAMRVFKSFRSVTICSVVISVVCALAGLLVSVPAGTPVGSTIVAADLLAFIAFYVVGKVKS